MGRILILRIPHLPKEVSGLEKAEEQKDVVPVVRSQEEEVGEADRPCAQDEGVSRLFWASLHFTFEDLR